MLVFPRGVADPDTLRRDMVKAGIPLLDKLLRPVGIHTFRRTVHQPTAESRRASSRDHAAGAAQEPCLTDSTYTDTTLLPLAEGIESLRLSPRKS